MASWRVLSQEGTHFKSCHGFRLLLNLPCRLNATRSLSTYLSSRNDGSGIFKVARVTPDGTIKKDRLKTSEILKTTKIYARDLLSLNLSSQGDRYVHHKYNVGPPAAILPRQDSILLSFGSIQAVASRESISIFDAHRPVVKEFCKELAGALHMGDHRNEALELIFLEEVLKETSNAWNRRIHLFQTVVDSILDKVGNEIFSDSGVHQLGPLKDSLQAFEAQVQQGLSCLTDLLNDDQDMLGLLLTEQAQAVEAGKQVAHVQHEKVELLLEVYTRQLSNTLQEVQVLLKRVQSKQEFVALALAGYRNRLVKMNVSISIVGLSLGLGTTVAGFFGMNLVNGWEASEVAFQYVVLSTGMTGLAVGIASLSYLSARSMQKRAEHSLQEIETLSGALSDMCAVDFILKSTMETGSVIDKYRFSKQLKRARRSGIATDEEIDLLFDALDKVQDGVLSGRDFDHYMSDQEDNLERETEYQNRNYYYF